MGAMEPAGPLETPGVSALFPSGHCRSGRGGFLKAAGDLPSVPSSWLLSPWLGLSLPPLSGFCCFEIGCRVALDWPQYVAMEELKFLILFSLPPKFSDYSLCLPSLCSVGLSAPCVVGERVAS